VQLGARGDKYMRRTTILLALLFSTSALCNAENLQTALEQAVNKKDGQQVEILLNKGADAFSPRGTQPSIFQEAIFR
jgi:hypothetical protein